MGLKACLSSGLCNGILIVLAFLTTVAVTFLYIVNGLALPILDISETDLFQSSALNISKEFPLQISPLDWTYYIWAVVFLWQIVWLIYSLSLMCATHKEGRLHVEPPVLPGQLYFLLTLNSLCSASWLFLWDQKWVYFALIPRSLIPFLLFVCLFISHRRLNYYAGRMNKLGLERHVFLIRGFVQNGLAFYLTWSCIVSLLNITVVLEEYALDNQLITSAIALGCMTLMVLAWFVTETFLLDRYVRYTVTPYFVLLWYITGVSVNNWAYPDMPMTLILTLSLAGVTFVLAIAKLFIMCFRYSRKPLYFCDHEAFHNFVTDDY